MFSAGAIILPSCLQKNSSAISLKNISVDGSQQKMLEHLTATIIPTTNFIGAKELKAHEFMLMMVDECYAPDKQTIFVNGLKEFDKLVDKKYGHSFADINNPQKIEWLNSLENKQGFSTDVLAFYNTAKQHTLQAFVTSKDYMVGVKKYNMVPGPIYKGCVPLKNKVA